MLKNSDDYRQALYIPRGCAYGFVTLDNNTKLNFKTDNYCKPEFEITYNLLDPFFSIKVPYPESSGEKNTFVHTAFTRKADNVNS